MGHDYVSKADPGARLPARHRAIHPGLALDFIPGRIALNPPSARHGSTWGTTFHPVAVVALSYLASDQGYRPAARPIFPIIAGRGPVVRGGPTHLGTAAHRRGSSAGVAGRVTGSGTYRCTGPASLARRSRGPFLLHRFLQKLRRGLLEFLCGLLLLLQVLLQQLGDVLRVELLLSEVLRTGEQAPIAGYLAVLYLVQGTVDQTITHALIRGFLHSLLRLGDQAHRRVARYRLRLQAHLRKDAVQILDLLLTLLHVLLDHAFQLRIGRHVQHLLLPLEEAVLGVIDIAELVQELLKAIRYSRCHCQLSSRSSSRLLPDNTG